MVSLDWLVMVAGDDLNRHGEEEVDGLLMGRWMVDDEGVCDMARGVDNDGWWDDIGGRE